MTKEVEDYISNENFFVVQVNMFGDVEVTDFDGDRHGGKGHGVKKWGAAVHTNDLFLSERGRSMTQSAQHTRRSGQ